MQIPPTASHEHARLALLNRSALLDTPAEIEFDRIVQLAASVFRVPIALVSLVDDQRQWFKAKVGLDVCQTGREVSFCGHVVANGRMLVVDNALHDDRFADNPLVLGDPGIRFYAGAPLLISDQLAIGTLCLIDRQPRQFTLQDQTLLQQLADALSDLIRKRMAVQLGQRQLRLLLTINQAQSSFLLDRDLGAACSTITQSLLDMSHCTLGFIASCQVNDSDTPYLAIPSIAHQQQDALQWLMRQLVPQPSGYHLYGLDHVFGQAIANGEPLVIRQPALYDPGGSLQPLQNLLVIPCFFHLSVLGVLVLANRAEGFDEEIVEHLTTLSDSIGTLLHVRELELARQAAEAELARQATLDPLTSLLNRRAFLDRCQYSQQRFARYRQRFSLLMLDLDHFKALNDRLGHPAGDHVLKEVGRMLREQLREIDIIARWGGEEFCILLPQETEQPALLLAERLCRTLAGLTPMWHDEPLSLTCSIGVATVHPDGEHTDTLIARADAAMYQAKAAGRNCARLAGTIK